MGNILVLEKTKIISDSAESVFREKLLKPESARINPLVADILAEGGADFIKYLRWLRLAKEPNLLVLSSTHHYYYDYNDLRTIKTLVNLKKLNNVKHLDSFLGIVDRILPQEANFIGCFNSNNREISLLSFYQSSKLLNRLANHIDFKTDRSLTKKEVSSLLEEHKLKVVDITDINGITYFYSRSSKV